ncbi:UNVERIFIED_CONTAM: hypothetical protein FKN15_014404 [Acipenser sinensis]
MLAFMRNSGDAIESVLTSFLYAFHSSFPQPLFTPFDDIIVEALCLVAFFGFLRCSEFSVPSIYSFQAIDPLFIDSSRIVITRHWFASHLNTLLSRSGLSTQFYSPHSFRIGATTYAARGGINQYLIKTMGHWSSSAVEAYISFPQPLFTPFDDIIVEALCLVAFFGFLRCSEFSVPSIYSFQAIDPLFIDSSRIVITRHWFASHLNTLLSRSGLSTQFYSPHSFRIGATTYAARGGINQYLIKTMGHWSSSAVEAYIRSSPMDIAAADQSLVSMPGVEAPSLPGPPEVSSQ